MTDSSVPADLRERVEVTIRECQALGSDAQDMAAAIFRTIDEWQDEMRKAHAEATLEPAAAQSAAAQSASDPTDSDG